MQDFSQLKQQVRQNIGRLDKLPSATEGLIRAAVSIVMIPAPTNSQAAILLTRRSRSLRRHAGSMPCPVAVSMKVSQLPRQRFANAKKRSV